MCGRRQRSGYSLLAAFLATGAELLGLMGTLDSNQRAAGGPRTGRFRRMLDDHRCGLPDKRRRSFAPFGRMLDDYRWGPTESRCRGFVSLHRLGLAPGYNDRAVDLARVVAAVQALGGQNGTISRLPDGGAGQLDPGPFAGATGPPIGWTRLGMTPGDEVVIVPIKVVVEPCAYRETDPEGN